MVVRLGLDGFALNAGSLSPETATSVSFDVKVTDLAALKDVVNTATVSYQDPLTESALTSTSNTTLTPVAGSTDLDITKSVDNSAVVAGESISYTLTAKNNGPSPATEVKVVDTIPTGLTNVVVTAAGGEPCTESGGQFTCIVGSLAPQQNATISITANVLPQLNGKAIANAANISGAQPDPVPENNRAVATAIVRTIVDLAVEKTFTPEAPTPGGEVTYTMKITNLGPSAATNVLLDDPIDPSSELLTAQVEPTGKCDTSGESLECTIPSLVIGEVATVTATVKLSQGSIVVQNTAVVTSSQFDSELANNTSSVGFSADERADMAVTKQSDPTQVMAGEPVGYRLTVSNAGPTAGKNVVLVDSLPVDLINPSVPPSGPCSIRVGQVRCRWAAFPVNSTEEVVITATTSTDAVDAISNSAIVGSSIPDPDPANNSATATTLVTTSADLAIAKKVSPEKIIPGERANYTLTVTNNGPTTAQGVTIVDPLPMGLTDIETDATCTVESEVLVCTAEKLPVGGSITAEFSAIVEPGLSGTLENTATVSALTYDPDLVNNTAEVVSKVTPRVDLAISKVADPLALLLGESVTYTVEVTNRGPSTAVDAVVKEALPEGLIAESVEVTGGEFSFASGDWSFPTLAVNQRETLTVTSKAVAAKEITNTVAVHLVNGDDANEDNNEASAVVHVTDPNPEPPIPPTTEPPVSPVNPGLPGSDGDPGKLSITGTNPVGALVLMGLTIAIGVTLILVRNRKRAVLK